MKHSWYGPVGCIPALSMEVEAPYAAATDLISLRVPFFGRLARWSYGSKQLVVATVGLKTQVSGKVFPRGTKFYSKFRYFVKFSFFVTIRACGGAPI